MKRCPECRRDYFDDTLAFCLDDGSPLLDGPARGKPKTENSGASEPDDEPKTAILPIEAETKIQISETEKTAVLPTDEIEKSVKGSTDSFSRVLLAIAIVGVVAIGAGYWYFSSGRQIESIAVMPFVNESGNEEVEYLSDGMTETLIGSLTRIPSLSVKARSTVFYYKGKSASPKILGEELGVDAVLLGRLVQRGDDLKLSLELVDTKTLDALWSKTYDRKINNLIALQSEIAKTISDELRIRLTEDVQEKVAREYTANPEAYKAYLQGRFHWNKRTPGGLNKGIEYFKQAIELDPTYALAWSGLADSYILLPEYTDNSSVDILPKAKAAAKRAIAADPDLAEAHTSLARVMHIFDWDFRGAEKEFQLAIELDPRYGTAHHWYSMLLSVVGRHDEAITEAKHAQELEPLSLIINFNLGLRFYYARRFSESTRVFEKAVETFPDFQLGRRWFSWSLIFEGKYDDAVKQCNDVRDQGSPPNKHCLGFIYAKAQKRIEARSLLTRESQENEHNKYLMALTYSLLGDFNEAFEILDELILLKSNSILIINNDPGSENIRNDPRFNTILRQIGLGE